MQQKIRRRLLLLALLACVAGGIGADGGSNDFSDAIIAFDRYACPQGWIEYGGPT